MLVQPQFAEDHTYCISPLKPIEAKTTEEARSDSTPRKNLSSQIKACLLQGPSEELQNSKPAREKVTKILKELSRPMEEDSMSKKTAGTDLVTTDSGNASDASLLEATSSNDLSSDEVINKRPSYITEKMSPASVGAESPAQSTNEKDQDQTA